MISFFFLNSYENAICWNHAINKLNTIVFTALSSMLMSIYKHKVTEILIVVFTENRRQLLFAQAS